MSYKNKVYISMDADNDINYYYMMKAWKQNDNIPFNFYDAHDINKNNDVSEESIKASLMERFRNSRVFVLLVGEHTRYLFKYVRWEIEQAIKRDLPCIVVNINGARQLDVDLCPPVMREHLSIHISFNSKILQYALENWPNDHNRLEKKGESGAYHYNEKVYSKLGL